MRIWIVNHYALHPSQAGGTRHFSLARQLAKHGHHVTIIASSVDYTTRTESRMPAGERWQLEVVDGVTFLWVRTSVYRDNGVRRLLNMIGFAARVARATGSFNMSPPDVVVGSSPHPFAALAAERLSNRYSVPFVLEVRDLWPQSLVELGTLTERHPLVVLLRRIERYLYRAADHIVCLLPGAEGHIAEHGARAPITWIPNGIDLQFAPHVAPPQGGGPFRLMYAGAHGVANGLGSVIEAARLLRDEGLGESILIDLVGDGAEKTRLQMRAQDLGLQNLRFHPPVPKSGIQEKLSEADGFLMILRDSPVFRWGVSPNKLFDYFAAGRPVIFAVNTPVNPVESASAGITVPADSPEALVGAIKRLAGLPEVDRLAMGRRGRAYVESNHDISRLADKLHTVLAGVNRG